MVWSGRTALHTAIVNSNPRIALSLIKAGADVNLPDHSSVTALQMADINSRMDKVAVDENGADVNVKDENDRTPLHSAAGTGLKGAASLIKVGADVDARDRDGRTPLHVAT